MVVGFLFGLLSPPLLAAAPQAGAGERPIAHVPRVQSAPKLDGRLDEPVWQEAVLLGPFTEVEPVEGRPAPYPTEVRLMQNGEFLFLGITCFEPEPEHMVLQNMARDAFLNDDDRLEIIFDTFNDRRTAYFFQVSAAGSRGDALINDNGRRFNKPWDTFWEAKVVILPDRWIIEMAVPFKGIGFSGQGTWGANFERYRGADRSRSRWSGARREFRSMTVSEAGLLTGFTGLDQGLGLEVAPYFKLRREQTDSPDTGNTLGAGGGELSWRITPQLTASATINTDFAETEVDERQVNLTRFPLFFPEKRDFFLQDSTLFEFGEQAGFGSGSNFIPYFTRRIGLDSNGNEVPLEAGLRLSGRVEGLDLGILAVHTGDVPADGVPSGELLVARPSLAVAEGVSVGALLTSGNPEADAQNFVTGVDARVSRTDWLPGTFNLNTYVLRSSDEAAGEVGAAYGLQATLRTSNWNFELEHLSTQSSFMPALGFVRRPGERRFAGKVRWEPRPESDAVRYYFFEIDPELWTDLSGEVQTYDVATTLFGIQWHNGDQFSLVHILEGDNPDAAFTPVTGSSIPAGDYDWQRVRGTLSFSDARPLSGSIQVEGGAWYNGQRTRASASLDWRPGAHFLLGLSYAENRADLPGGDFATRVAILRTDVAFSPEVTLQNLIQADNVSDVLGLQSRLRWIEADGQEAFVVLNLNWQELPGSRLVPISQDLTVKVVYSLRF